MLTLISFAPTFGEMVPILVLSFAVLALLVGVRLLNLRWAITGPLIAALFLIEISGTFFLSQKFSPKLKMANLQERVAQAYPGIEFSVTDGSTSYAPSEKVECMLDTECLDPSRGFTTKSGEHTLVKYDTHSDDLWIVDHDGKKLPKDQFLSKH